MPVLTSDTYDRAFFAYRRTPHIFYLAPCDRSIAVLLSALCPMRYAFITFENTPSV
jgi:hypothetical protein